MKTITATSTGAGMSTLVASERTIVADTAKRGDKWSPSEISVLREYYPTGGSGACAKLFPGRTAHAIRGRAYQVGIQRS
jgi:hypothetical protein